MKLHTASHLDHGLSGAQVAYLLNLFADRRAFFIETVELPEALGTVPCGLYGPIMGDAAVLEADVAYRCRGDRAYTSRVLLAGAVRPSCQVTVIAGPHEEPCDPAHHWPKQCVLCEGEGVIKHPCIVYTAFGGPLAPQEPGDPTCRDAESSARFWRDHALAL